MVVAAYEVGDGVADTLQVCAAAVQDLLGERLCAFGQGATTALARVYKKVSPNGGRRMGMGNGRETYTASQLLLL